MSFPPTQTFETQSVSVSSDGDVPSKEAWGKFIAFTPKTCQTILFEEDSYTFGRGKSNTVVLEPLGISGTHCVVWKENIDGMDKCTAWIEDRR
jgi:hypothetical protein